MENKQDIDNVLDEFVSSDETTTETTSNEGQEIMPPQEPQAQSVEVAEPTKPVQEPQMVVPKNIKVGGLAEEQSTEVKLKDEDKTTENNKIISNRTFTIKEVSIREDLIQRNIKDNVPMEVFNDEKPDELGYTTKLRILYEDTDYASYIPTIKWYYNDKQGSLDPWIYRGELKEHQFEDRMISTITKLYNRYCKFIGVEVGKVTTKDFVEGLVGKKVVLEQNMSEYKGKTGFRLDIYAFKE